MPSKQTFKSINTHFLIFIILSLLLLFFCNQSCIATYSGISYETSNTLTIKTTNKPDRQTFRLFLSARQGEYFEKITSHIIAIFKKWEKKTPKITPKTKKITKF